MSRVFAVGCDGDAFCICKAKDKDDAIRIAKNNEEFICGDSGDDWVAHSIGAWLEDGDAIYVYDPLHCFNVMRSYGNNGDDSCVIYAQGAEEGVSMFKYGMRLRGFSPMCQPKGVIKRQDDPTGKYYDIILYDRELTENELSYYELDYLGEVFT